MRMKLMMSAVLASLVAVAGCNRDTEVAATTNVGPDVVTTPNEAASQAPAPMPDTIAGAEARIDGGPMPAAPVTGHTLVESQVPGPGGSSYLVDGAGRAVYMLEGDRDGSKCTGSCLQAWPPLLVTDTRPTAGANLEPSLVGTVQRPDGSMQVTYNGHPLYHYAADAGRGMTTGHAVRDQSGSWYLLDARGAQHSGNGQAAGPPGGAR